MTANHSGVTWGKSSWSGANGDCVEVGRGLPGLVAVRDSKDRGGPALVFTQRAWQEFITRAKDGAAAAQ
ncbi:MAG: DUF397 domain-containing protein [Actinobacteria bacterium]|nr:DUF397 domain-containing protein [Actinomycetota bacterium]MBO0786438.1 DUF397 domain-containing protein [Actinomycetota bacterium]MBO0818011.1 DUF397 domain-containing protein [Actinomycetota bacterium]